MIILPLHLGGDLPPDNRSWFKVLISGAIKGLGMALVVEVMIVPIMWGMHKRFPFGEPVTFLIPTHDWTFCAFVAWVFLIAGIVAEAVLKVSSPKK